ncbi:MAG: Transcriptional regulator, TetR family [Candidatus Jettenia ecosi]|uniref:Transcriptional regulator, TetR family n=1 Tax=Candidatus Jettenia ecosi TaxID=2494326 RepID=A0A533Q987_9BACT|nr:MAG: Transcriptional regulator, TetR family [Candidatus Jettenia ecosi]
MKTKDRILKTGLKLFSKKGYLGATTKEIAKTAGIAEITLFRHFPSKERLFEEVINAYSFLPALKGLLPEIAELSYEEGLRIIAKRFLDSLTIRKGLIQIMHSEIHRYSEKIHRIYHSIIDEVFKTLASYFAEMQKKGVLKAFDTELGARAFLGMFFSYFDAENFLMLKKYRRTDTETIIREFVMIFAGGTKK